MYLKLLNINNNFIYFLLRLNNTYLNYLKNLAVNENIRSNLRYFLFRYYENKTKSLALMEAASSQRSEEIQRTAGGLILENTNSSAPEKTSTCQVVHNS